MASNNYPPPPGPPPGKELGAGGYAPSLQNHYGNGNNRCNANHGGLDYRPPFIPLQEQPGQGPPKYDLNPNNGMNGGFNDPPPPYTFEQKFALPKPKYNDLWAAILFVIDFFGLVAVSGISLNAYRATKGTNGNGIYDDRGNDFGLSTNTIILFAFVLVIALAVSTLYLIVARKFTKKLIWITGILK
jgi:hypothetical protein